MKSLKVILISFVGAVALLVAVSPARAVFAPPPPPPPSDIMQLFTASTAPLPTESAIATEAGELAKPTLGPASLFFFDSFSNVAATGTYIAIADSPGGPISDVIGVTGVFAGVGITSAFAFQSDAGETGLTPAQIAADGFFTQLGPTLVEGPNGIFLDSRTNAFMASFIDFTKTGPGAFLTFFSDGPDSGSAVALLGIALAGIEGLRRRIGARKA